MEWISAVDTLTLGYPSPSPAPQVLQLPCPPPPKKRWHPPENPDGASFWKVCLFGKCFRYLWGLSHYSSCILLRGGSLIHAWRPSAQTESPKRQVRSSRTGITILFPGEAEGAFKSPCHDRLGRICEAGNYLVKPCLGGSSRCQASAMSDNGPIYDQTLLLNKPVLEGISAWLNWGYMCQIVAETVA